MSRTAAWDGVLIRPAVLWKDQPAICEATIGRSPHTLERWERQGLSGYTLGNRKYWFTEEVLAFLRVVAAEASQ